MECLIGGVILVLVAVIGGIYWTKCPKCERLFARYEVSKKTLRKIGWWFSEWLTTYRCIYCGHVWEVKGTSDTDYP